MPLSNTTGADMLLGSDVSWTSSVLVENALEVDEAAVEVGNAAAAAVVDGAAVGVGEAALEVEVEVAVAVAVAVAFAVVVTAANVPPPGKCRP